MNSKQYNISNLLQQSIDEFKKAQDVEIRKCLKPKPKWLPTFIYHYLLSKLIYIEFVHKSIKK